MATIACPQCSKTYTLPESSAGRMATCRACGARFRVGKATPLKPALADDDVWDELDDPKHVDLATEGEAPPDRPIDPDIAAMIARAEEIVDVQQAHAKEEAASWGFRWDLVIVGLIGVVLSGAIAAVSYSQPDMLKDLGFDESTRSGKRALQFWRMAPMLMAMAAGMSGCVVVTGLMGKDAQIDHSKT